MQDRQWTKEKKPVVDVQNLINDVKLDLATQSVVDAVDEKNTEKWDAFFEASRQILKDREGKVRAATVGLNHEPTKKGAAVDVRSLFKDVKLDPATQAVVEDDVLKPRKVAR